MTESDQPPPEGAEGSGVSRRRFLGMSALTLGTLLHGSASVPGAPAPETAEAAPPTSLAGMNVVLFITDQERALQHFPPGWARKNMPGLRRLQAHGLTFANAFTNACMCSPARSTLMSGYFPAQHGVKYTLEDDMSPPANPQVELPLPDRIANIATVMSASGYNVIYKGKWHCSKMAGATWEPSDVNQYGFSRWNPPDAGANQDLTEMGGGVASHDLRFMASRGDQATGDEGSLEFLTGAAASLQPFFMIISLVNPHDVLAYPRLYGRSGYSREWLEGEIGLPATVSESLRDKPTAQRAFRALSSALGPLPTDQRKRNYLNFYGNLIRSSDNFLVNILRALQGVPTATGRTLYEDTLVIKTSDHGEMGMAHGGLRQKNFNFYEEAIRVPLVYSNPQLWPKGRTTKALVSHVDFLPTLASLFDAPANARSDWQGRDYSRLVLRKGARPVQNYVTFTYDDFQAGQPTGPYVPPPQFVVAIRESRWKLAKYYDPSGERRTQWEMYDLRTDPLETKNIAWPSYPRTKAEDAQLARLRRKLARVEATRLQPLA
jgi:arylsulfatase A-like enzyme